MSTNDLTAPGESTAKSGTLEDKGRELGRKADAATARVQDTWNETKSRLSHSLEAKSEAVKDGLASARRRVTEEVQTGRAKVEHEVQVHPFRTLLYAFGAGALVGLLLSYRSRHRS